MEFSSKEKRDYVGVVMDKSVYLDIDDPSKLRWAAVDGENNSEVVALALENLKIKVAQLRNGRHKAENNVDAITGELERLRTLLKSKPTKVQQNNGIVSNHEVASKDPSQRRNLSPLVSAKQVSQSLGQQLTSLKRVVESMPLPGPVPVPVQKRKASVEKTSQQVPSNINDPIMKKYGEASGKKERKKIVATHYHLNLAHVPFLLSKNVNPSHSSIAAIQQLVATLKSHNILCNMCDACKEQPNVKHNIKSLMSLLREEHGHFCKHWSQLEQKGSGMSQSRIENLKRKIKNKADQIEKLRQLQEELSKIPCDIDEEPKPRNIPSHQPRVTMAKSKRVKPKTRPSMQNLMRRAKIMNALLDAGDKRWD